MTTMHCCWLLYRMALLPLKPPKPAHSAQWARHNCSDCSGQANNLAVFPRHCPYGPHIANPCFCSTFVASAD